MNLRTPGKVNYVRSVPKSLRGSCGAPRAIFWQKAIAHRLHNSAGFIDSISRRGQSHACHGFLRVWVLPLLTHLRPDDSQIMEKPIAHRWHHSVGLIDSISRRSKITHDADSWRLGVCSLWTHLRPYDSQSWKPSPTDGITLQELLIPLAGGAESRQSRIPGDRGLCHF